MSCGTNGTLIAVNDTVCYVYSFESEMVWSSAIVTAKGTANPQQHISCHVVPDTENPADEFDVSDAVHDGCANSDGQWSCVSEFVACGGGGIRPR